LLCPWERHLMLFTLLGLSSLLVVVAQPDERHTNSTTGVGVVWQIQRLQYLVQRSKTRTSIFRLRWSLANQLMCRTNHSRCRTNHPGCVKLRFSNQLYRAIMTSTILIHYSFRILFTCH